MNSVKVSPKFQIVIPKAVRESIPITQGDSLQVVTYGNRIELIPVKPIGSLKGSLKGMSTEFKREGDRV